MILNLYAVKDELANNFLSPTLISDDNLAKRQFKTQINTLDLWRENASDFSLYMLGSFNEETGEIIPKIEKIAGGRSVLNA